MKSKILFIIFLFSFVAITSSQSDAKVEVKKVIDLFFKGLQSGDTAMVKSTVQDPILQTTAMTKENKTLFRTTDFSKFLNSLANKNPKDTWEEKLLSFNIQIDGTMANVWTPYEFYFNDAFSHCGVNTFQLIAFNGEWKIVYLIDTRRKESCKK